MRIGFRIVEGANVRDESLELGVIKIGRLPSSHVRLDDPDTSRMHAVMEVIDHEAVAIIDLGSMLGTFVNGQRVNKAMLWHGDVIGIASARIEISFSPPAMTRYTPTDARERALLDAILRSPDDRAAYEVYADWLETVGRAEHAAYLRFDLNPMESAWRTGRIPILQDRAADGWRAIVSRGCEIDGCSNTSCSKRWDRLAATEDDGVRRCGTCNANVHFVSTIHRAAYAGRARECIAVDPAIDRGRAKHEYDRDAAIPRSAQK